jgi:2-methylisocitrate lyase-like PEP mutase family enzyme
VEAPLLINLVPGGLTPIESAVLLQELGYAIAIHPGTPLARGIVAMLEALCELKGATAADVLPGSPAEFFNLLGLAEWAKISEKYQTGEAQQWA